MKEHVEPRPKIAPSKDVVLTLCYNIRDQLYQDHQRPHFYAQLRDLKKCVTYPASWLNKKGVFVGPERYQEILLAILQDVKRKGATATVQYWPRYLLTVVQQHFAHSGDRYYTEGKHARDAVGRIVAGLAPTTAPDQFTRDLAAVHDILTGPKNTRKKPPAPAATITQPTLL